MGHIHLSEDNSWVDIISEMPRVLKLDRIWLGRNLSEGPDPDKRPLEFDGAIGIARTIESLILKTDDATLEATCSEIRRLLQELLEALRTRDEDEERYHQELFADHWHIASDEDKDEEDEWASTSGEEGEEEDDEWASTSEEEGEEEESDSHGDDNALKNAE